jgi:hypothetical protein
MKKVQAAIIGIVFMAILIGSQTLTSNKERTGAEPGKGTGTQSFGDDRGTLEAIPSQPTEHMPLNASAKFSSLPSAGNTAIHPKWASLEELMRWDTHDLEVIKHPEGHVSVRGSGRFTHMSVSVRDASGRRVIQCFANYADLDDTLSGRRHPLPKPTDDIEYEVSDF